MKRTLYAAAAIVAAIGTTPTLAGESHSKTQCGWSRGVYICSSNYESDYSKSHTFCATGVYGTGGCDTKTETKEPEPVSAPPSNEFVPFDAGTMQRAKAREAENAKNGRKGVVVCGPDHWVKDHWEPSCR